MEKIYSQITDAYKSDQKQLAVLIDPDDLKMQHIEKLVYLSQKAEIDYFFIGGSLITDDVMDECVTSLKQSSDIPCIIFPGSQFQINEKADAILYLSLISGRNPDLLIGQQMIAAPYIKKSGLEALSTGYMLIDGGKPTTASYISGTQPIPSDKPDIAASTAMAGEMLGHKLIYMDAGSGAQYPVNAEMIEAVRDAVSIPVIVGGGIKSLEKCESAIHAGADIIVIGNAIEKDPSRVENFSNLIHSMESRIV